MRVGQALTTLSPPGVTDEDRAFVAPYRTLLPEDASQLCHSLREVVNDALTH
jgi:hypothetical protein